MIHHRHPAPLTAASLSQWWGGIDYLDWHLAVAHDVDSATLEDGADLLAFHDQHHADNDEVLKAVPPPGDLLPREPYDGPMRGRFVTDIPPLGQSISDAPDHDDTEELLADAVGPVKFRDWRLRTATCLICLDLSERPATDEVMWEIREHAFLSHPETLIEGSTIPT